MITERLLTSSRRDAIKALRSKNDLNQDAFKWFAKILLFYCLPSLFIYALVIVSSLYTKNVLFFALASVVLAVIIRFYANKIWDVFFAPYLMAANVCGIVQSLGYARNGDVTAYVSNSSEGLQKQIDLTIFHNRSHVQKGNEVPLFSIDGKFAVLQDIDNMKKFCIKKSMLDE